MIDLYVLLNWACALLIVLLGLVFSCLIVGFLLELIQIIIDDAKDLVKKYRDDGRS